MDDDGTNKEVVFIQAPITGTYVFPFNNTTRLLIPDKHLGAGSFPANSLYSYSQIA